MELTMTSTAYPPVDQLILLYSYSFEEGAILTKDAFIEFLKCAMRDEVSNAEFYFITVEQSAYLEHELYSQTEIRHMLLGTLELQ